MSHAGRQSLRAAGGFMLSETLAVMTISAFILAGLVTVTGVMLRSVDNSVARMQDVDNLIRAMSAISRDASALFRARWAGAEPQGLIFSGEEGSVMFPDIEKALDGTRHLSIVRYQTGPGRGLFRSSSKLGTLAASRSDLRFGNPQVIYDGGAQFRFMFVDKAQDKGPEKKLALWTSSQTLPTSMIVEAVDPASGTILSSLRVDFRANADLGCLASDFCGRKDKTPAGQASAQAASPQPAGQGAGRSTPGGP